jgi:hypothetical protein
MLVKSGNGRELVMIKKTGCRAHIEDETQVRCNSRQALVE